VGSLALRPGDLLTILKMALSIGYRSSVVGIEIGRASFRWEVTSLALFDCEVGAQFHHGRISRSPPIIPDGQISRVRFETLACPL
jgi:hypothetical protein